jgi:hypothetical protein
MHVAMRPIAGTVEQLKKVRLVVKLEAAQELKREATGSGMPHLAPVMQKMLGRSIYMEA